MDQDTTDAFSAHVRLLEKMALDGNELAIRSLACMVLLLANEDVNPGAAENVIALFANAA